MVWAHRPAPTPYVLLCSSTRKETAVGAVAALALPRFGATAPSGAVATQSIRRFDLSTRVHSTPSGYHAHRCTSQLGVQM